jgi:phage regulator Rha-like protein
MEQLVFKSGKGTPVTNSLLVAQKFGKQHKDVLEAVRTLAENSADLPNIRNMFYKASQPDTRAIEGVISQTPETQSQRNFALSEYNDSSGKSNPLYIWNS